MELTVEQQIFEQFKKANKILIALPESLTADSLSSGLALMLFLKKLEKDVEIVSSGSLPLALSFLPETDKVRTDVDSLKSLVAILDTTAKPLEEISYQTEEGKVKIFLRSKTSSFTSEDISFTTDKFPVDAVVILECKSLEDLGKLFENHISLFYETPKINIDNQAANEYFGSVNLVDLTATSVAEILTGLFEKYEQQLVDEPIATCLLTGIIAKTNSFQHSQTTPKAFLHASQLVALGGRQQEIVKNLYKTKTLSFLKLWGRTLARLKLLEDFKVAYSVLNSTDFEKAESSNQDLFAVLKELLDNISNYKIVGIIGEGALKQTNVLIAANSQAEAAILLKEFGKEAKILPLPQSSYTVASLELTDIPITEIENKFLMAVKNLPRSQ
jgi:nanoRNase/pAp phosphatase (c-di-AMP/oligoRNAs hydrolase)